MSRPRGHRNTDFAATREALAARIAHRLQESDGAGVSFRELAATAGVTPPTLTHYFGGRAGALQAAYAWLHAAGQPYLTAVRSEPTLGVRPSLLSLVQFLVEGLQAGVARQLVTGLSEAGREPVVGIACVTECLEPILTSVEARLSSHAARGELTVPDARVAALQLVAPIVLAVLHQDMLDGRAVRPLAMAGFLEQVVDAFLHGYAADAS